MIIITALNVYPVKSLAGIPLRHSEVRERGILNDRRWMVTDSEYRFVTQREIPAMALIDVQLNDVALTLRTQDERSISIPLDTSAGKTHRGTIWRDEVEAIDEGDAVSRWLTSLLGECRGGCLRLVRMPDEYERRVDPQRLQHEWAVTAFADAYPILVANEESLTTLNIRLAAKRAATVAMNRFRPNIVISGLDALAENDTSTLTAVSGQYALGLRKPCERCKIVTIDPRSAEIADPREPLKTLMEMKPFADSSKAYFGQNALLLSGVGSVISVGDKLK